MGKYSTALEELMTRWVVTFSGALLLESWNWTPGRLGQENKGPVIEEFYELCSI